MPSSIPYDHPSLALGNIINPAILSKLKQIGGLQAKIDAAQDKMNSHVSLKRSIEMTINEMINMNVDVSELVGKIKDIDASIVKAAIDYATIRLANETSIQSVKEEIAEAETDDNLESPVDFTNTVIQSLPLSSDSLKMDAQYFSYDGNDPSGGLSSVESYIKESAGSLGSKASSEIAKTASAQISLQQKNHGLSGTLVITASCTHKNAVLLSPCVIDIDKAVPVWNKMFPDSKINTADEKSILAITEQEETANSKNFSILSGAAYGSSFVGMVHILKQSTSSAGNTPSLTDLADSMQERLTIGNWFEEASGGFGIDSSIVDDIKNLLNTQKITSHITVVVMGSVPSIRSNQLQMGIKTLTDLDTGKLNASVSTISGATTSEKKTVDQAANAAKTGAKIMAVRNSIVQTVMSGLAKVDQGANKIMDINSMMTAFEDYLEEVKKGSTGVPINFYLKTISQHQLARMWLDKYYPDKTNTAL